MAGSTFAMITNVYAQFTRMSLRAEHLKLLQKFVDYNGRHTYNDWTTNVQIQRDQFDRFQRGKNANYDSTSESGKDHLSCTVPLELEASIKTLNEIIEYEITEWDKAKKKRITNGW